MIPADRFYDNDDGTAWMIVREFVERNDRWWDSARYLSDLDRPCDCCNGEYPFCTACGDVSNGGAEATGRNTFNIEVACSSAYHEPTARRVHGECHYCQDGRRTYRVSIVSGMVLPLLDGGQHLDQYPPNAVYWTKGEGWWVDSDFDNIVTLPPAAKPGMWVVKLRLTPENVEESIDNLARLHAAGCDIVQTADDPEFCWTHNRTGGDCLAELDAPENVEEP